MVNGLRDFWHEDYIAIPQGLVIIAIARQRKLERRHNRGGTLVVARLLRPLVRDLEVWVVVHVMARHGFHHPLFGVSASIVPGVTCQPIRGLLTGDADADSEDHCQDDNSRAYGRAGRMVGAG